MDQHPSEFAFEVEQAGRIGEALHDGRLEEAEAIRCYLLAETDASGAHAHRLDRLTTAMMLLTQSAEARRRGDIATADTLAQQIHQHIDDPAEIQAMLAGALVAVGRRDGWLPEDQYDLVHGIAAGNPATEALLTQIHRGHPNTTA